MDKMIELESFLGWAKKNEQIRGLILTGSRANPKAAKDYFSDFDIAVFGESFRFIEGDDWINEFRKFWICIRDKYDLLRFEIPTRLVIFNEKLKIDFSFLPMDLLKNLIDTPKLPDGFNVGYTILLDKDDLLSKLPKPTFEGFIVKKPSEKDYTVNTREFWFEIVHAAKYLSRNDLWTAKFRDWSAKQWLLQMLEWNRASRSKWNFSPKPYGREMVNWVDVRIWERLDHCFSEFDKSSSWVALANTVQLYREVAKETARALDYIYDEGLDLNISNLIEKVKQR